MLHCILVWLQCRRLLLLWPLLNLLSKLYQVSIAQNNGLLVEHPVLLISFPMYFKESIGVLAHTQKKQN